MSFRRPFGGEHEEAVFPVRYLHRSAIDLSHLLQSGDQNSCHQWQKWTFNTKAANIGLSNL
jgi:hypothetical protein